MGSEIDGVDSSEGRQGANVGRTWEGGEPQARGTGSAELEEGDKAGGECVGDGACKVCSGLSKSGFEGAKDSRLARFVVDDELQV